MAVWIPVSHGFAVTPLRARGGTGRGIPRALGFQRPGYVVFPYELGLIRVDDPQSELEHRDLIVAGLREMDSPSSHFILGFRLRPMNARLRSSQRAHITASCPIPPLCHAEAAAHAAPDTSPRPGQQRLSLQKRPVRRRRPNRSMI
jgi:hypothetical protein